MRPATCLNRSRILPTVAAWACLAAPLYAQAPADRNVVYGMYSGLGLLMDVHRPAEPNGYGLIWIWGSGFHQPLPYGTRPVTAFPVPQLFLDAGYTLFVITHREAPRFRYPAAVEDAQRAVRFVRYHAREYGIHPARLAGWGGSSGAHLVGLLGTMDGAGDPDDPDPVNRESAKLQAVIARAAPTDLLHLDGISWFAASAFASFIGGRVDLDQAKYRAASPITYVTPDDPPFLLVHGDADAVVPFHQSELMLEALQAQGVDARLLRIPGGGHGANDVVASVSWLNQHLLEPTQATALEPLLDARAHLEQGKRLLTAGDVPGAVQAYREAQQTSGRLTVTGSDWNMLCWVGALWQRAADVMAACEQAVRLLPMDPNVRDSRALARALTGDREGAIADFEFFVDHVPTRRPQRAQREGWIAALRAGDTPFTPEYLERLRRDELGE